LQKRIVYTKLNIYVIINYILPFSAKI
jgi:hypothetical protein